MLSTKFSLQIGEYIGESFNDVVDSSESEIDSRGCFVNNDLEKDLGGKYVFRTRRSA